MQSHERFMKEAIRLAQKARGKTSPNPLVGAVIVKNEKIISRGYHKKAGLEHAEAQALRRAGKQANDADLYVNLEPCAHFGKTPPCADAIINSGIKKVIIGTRDPNPVNRGKGIKLLMKNGVNVKCGVLKKESENLNRAFAKFITSNVPYVTVKLAQSLDGKIAARSGDSKWVSGRDSIEFVHKERKAVDAVLVGINTVIKDNPLLTSRLPRISAAQPKRVVIDTRLRIPWASNLLKEPRKLVIATTEKAPKKKLRDLRNRGVEIIVTKNDGGRVDLLSALRGLAELDIMHVMVEGGGEAAWGFLKKGLVDEVLFFISPKIIGGRSAVTSVEGEGAKFIKDAIPVKNIKIKRFRNDILLWGQVSSHVYRYNPGIRQS